MVASPPFPSPLLPPFSRSPSPPSSFPPSSHSSSLSPRLLRQEKLNPELVVPFLYARCREARSLPCASQGRDTRTEDERRGEGRGTKREWTNERKEREREIGNRRYFCNGYRQQDEYNARKTRVRASCFFCSLFSVENSSIAHERTFLCPIPITPAEIETFERRCTCGARRIVTRPRFEFQPILGPLSFYSGANHICEFSMNRITVVAR